MSSRLTRKLSRIASALFALALVVGCVHKPARSLSTRAASSSEAEGDDASDRDEEGKPSDSERSDDAEAGLFARHDQALRHRVIALGDLLAPRALASFLPTSSRSRCGRPTVVRLLI